MPLWLAEKANLHKISYQSGIHKQQFKNNYYILSRKSIGIDDVVSFPENRVVANKFAVDIEECLRTLSSHLVEGIEQAWRDREAGLGVGALYRFQGGLVRIEDDTA